MSRRFHIFGLIFCLCTTFNIAFNETLSAQVSRDGKNRYLRYAEGLIKQYDANKDGFLDLGEQEKMRRRPSVEADQNNDGKVSMDELSIVLAGQNVSRRTTDKAEPASENQGQQDLDIRFGLLDIKSSDAEAMQRICAKAKTVGFIKFGDQIAALGQEDNVKVHEILEMSMVAGKTTSLQSGGTTPVKTGASVSRSGQKVFSYQDMETGFNLRLTPHQENGKVEIDMDLTKSYLEEVKTNADQGFAPTSVKRLQYTSTVLVDEGAITAINLQTTGQTWVLLIGAAKRNIEPIADAGKPSSK